MVSWHLTPKALLSESLTPNGDYHTEALQGNTGLDSSFSGSAGSPHIPRLLIWWICCVWAGTAWVRHRPGLQIPVRFLIGVPSQASTGMSSHVVLTPSSGSTWMGKSLPAFGDSFNRQSTSLLDWIFQAVHWTAVFPETGGTLCQGPDPRILPPSPTDHPSFQVSDDLKAGFPSLRVKERGAPPVPLQTPTLQCTHPWVLVFPRALATNTPEGRPGRSAN